MLHGRFEHHLVPIHGICAAFQRSAILGHRRRRWVDDKNEIGRYPLIPFRMNIPEYTLGSGSFNSIHTKFFQHIANYAPCGSWMSSCLICLSVFKRKLTRWIPCIVDHGKLSLMPCIVDRGMLSLSLPPVKLNRGIVAAGLADWQTQRQSTTIGLDHGGPVCQSGQYYCSNSRLPDSSCPTLACTVPGRVRTAKLQEILV